MKVDHVIYCTTNLINGKKYIGYNKYNDPKYLGSGKILKWAIKKHGKENFKKQILEYCETQENADIAEQYWIDYFGAVESDVFYNMARGGLKPNFGDIWNKGKSGCYSKETIEKIRQGSIGNTNASGKRTLEQRKRISDATKKARARMPWEVKQRGGFACKGTPKPPRTKEYVAKMKASHTGKIPWNKKNLKRYDLENKLIRIYELARDVNQDDIKLFDLNTVVDKDIVFENSYWRF